MRAITSYHIGQKWRGLGFTLRGSSRYHTVPLTAEEVGLLATCFNRELTGAIPLHGAGFWNGSSPVRGL